MLEPANAQLSPRYIVETVKDGDEIGWAPYIRRLWLEERDRMTDFVRRIALQEYIYHPILVAIEDGGHRMWDGHHRVAAALALEIDSIPVTYIDARTKALTA